MGCKVGPPLIVLVQVHHTDAWLDCHGPAREWHPHECRDLSFLNSIVYSVLSLQSSASIQFTSVVSTLWSTTSLIKSLLVCLSDSLWSSSPCLTNLPVLIPVCVPRPLLLPVHSACPLFCLTWIISPNLQLLHPFNASLRLHLGVWVLLSLWVHYQCNLTQLQQQKTRKRKTLRPTCFSELHLGTRLKWCHNKRLLFKCCCSSGIAGVLTFQSNPKLQSHCFVNQDQ